MSKFIDQYLNEIKFGVIQIVDVSKFKYEWHEVANTEPKMCENDFNALKNNISKLGQNEPIVVYMNKVIDGRHRQKACIELNMPMKVIILNKNYTTPQLREIVRSIHMKRDKTMVQKQIQAYRYKRTTAGVTWDMASSEYSVKTITIKRINTLYNLLTSNGFYEDFDKVINSLFMGMNLLPRTFSWIETPTSSFSSAVKQFKNYLSLEKLNQENEEIDSTEQQKVIDQATGEVLIQDIKKEDNPLIDIVALKESEIMKLKTEVEILREKLKIYEEGK